MRERLDQLLQTKKMCLNEIKQATTNCEQYSSNITALSEALKENGEEFNCFLAEYDTLITNITAVMDATRKFNINMLLNSGKLCDLQAVLSKRKQTKESEVICGNTDSLNEHKNGFFPVEEYNFNSEDVDDFVYPTLNLSEVYKANDVIIGTITYIKNLSNLSFYVFDYSSKYALPVAELSKSLELHQYHGLPMASEVFGSVLDNQIFRAVLSSKTFYDVEMNEKIFPCYLLDTGEILPLKAGHIMYKLTNYQKNIPALALPCQLIHKNPFLTEKLMEDKVKKLEYKKCLFKIAAIENNTLHIEIIDDANMVKTQDDSGNQAVSKVTLEKKSSKTDQLQLTEEEYSMLYEEPLGTSNAMKAVMGYDPQDDKRICRFYNPLTGGCFKGVNCKLEHTLRQPEGWTKDVIPTTTIMDTQHPITIFKPDSIINITPTYVGQLDRFYAQINEANTTSAPLIWNNEDVPSYKLLHKPPHMFELVLSRYIDGLWYRAKVMSHDDEYKMFQVLYVDYGNTQVVPLRNLASIESSMAQLPYQAVLCRFENVKEKVLSTDDRKNCIEIVCEMILNKSMYVKVISHCEDLFISLVDKKNYPLPDVLIEMGYMTRI